jgi:putative inorganic carbon (hco3(-)) transporter
MQLFIAVAVALALAAAAYVLWQLPVIYVFCAGLVLSIFSGNWEAMGLPGFPFLPDRFLLIGALFMVALRAPGARNRPALRLTPAHWLLALTVLYVTVSAAAAGTLGDTEATFALVDRLGAIPFLMLLAAPLIVRTDRDRNILLTALVALGAYLGLVALFEAVGANLVFPHYIIDPDVGTFDGRARGPFTSPVTFGFALFGCAVAAAVAVATHPQPSVRRIAWLVVPLCTLGCFFTLERGVWIATVMGGIAAALTSRQLRSRMVPVTVVAVLAVGAAITLVPDLESRTQERTQTTLSVWDRQNQNAAAMRMIADRPLFGFGWARASQDGLPYFRQADSYPMTGFNIEFHNVYLSHAVELGLVGFSLWLLAQAVALGAALTGRIPGELQPWRTGLLALVMFMVVVSLFNPLGQNYAGLLLWTWAGVVLAGVPVFRRYEESAFERSPMTPALAGS